MEDIKINMTPTVKAAVSHFQAKKDKCISELEIFLNRPIGLRGHLSNTDEVIRLLEELHHSNSMLETINSIINKQENL